MSQNNNWWNPLSYYQSDLPSLNHQQSHSSLSTLLQQQQSSTALWYNPLSWLNQQQQEIHIDEESINTNGTLTTHAMNKLVKETKRLILKDEPIWAWYQSSNNEIGELSIFGSKTETSPLQLSHYPFHHDDTINDYITLPSWKENFRKITVKTKIRIAFELYYNFPTERHLYLKSNIKPCIKKALVITVSNDKSINSKDISNKFKASILKTLEINDDKSIYKIDTISIELGKSKLDSIENIFKLLINWREIFLDINFLIIVGIKETINISIDLLNILIKRKSFPNLNKSGLILIEPKKFNSINSLNELAYKNNTKISIFSSLNLISNSFLLELNHPNINRFLITKDLNEDNANFFKIQLFKMLLISINLNKIEVTKKLIIQISKYFKNTDQLTDKNITEENLIPIITQQLYSTSLIKSKPIRIDDLNDELINNKYNLIWNFHAFLDDFKKLPNISTIKEIMILLKSFKIYSNFINSIDLKNKDMKTKDLKNKDIKDGIDKIEHNNAGISAEDKEFSQMLEVLKIEEYCEGLI